MTSTVEIYPGWLKAFEKQRKISDERRREQGDEPHPDETWERWKREILDDEERREILGRSRHGHPSGFQ